LYSNKQRISGTKINQLNPSIIVAIDNEIYHTCIQTNRKFKHSSAIHTVQESRHLTPTRLPLNTIIFNFFGTRSTFSLNTKEGLRGQIKTYSLHADKMSIGMHIVNYKKAI
jgi:hypothetical protein